MDFLRTASMVFVLTTLWMPANAFAENAEIKKLIKTCEARAAQKGVSGRICACTPKKMNEYGYTDEEILKYSKPGYKPQDIVEYDRYLDYSMKMRLMPGQCKI